MRLCTDESAAGEPPQVPCLGDLAAFEPKVARDGAGYRALIVEDEPVLAKNIVTYLRRRGVAASAVGSGGDALRWMASHTVDVVLVDYDLPGMDGLTLIRSIRARSRALPIVMVTGRGDAGIESRALDAGAGVYRTKPIALAEVKRVLDALVGRD